MNASIKIPFFSVNEKTGRYSARRTLTEAQIIKAADTIIKKRVTKGFVFSGSVSAANYCRSLLLGLEQEVFICLFLTNQHRLIESEELSRGTIDSASVYPREVVKRVLHHNAAAVIFAHNHPSGINEPSGSDIGITSRLKDALRLIDVRVLDHVIIGDGLPLSMAEIGLL